MNTKFVAAAAAALTLATGGLNAGTADAKGCIKGAVVGGAGGMLVHHPFIGAATGCVVGHHMAHEKAKREREAQRRGYEQHGQTTTTTTPNNKPANPNNKPANPNAHPTPAPASPH